jgi:hypothetical protein
VNEVIHVILERGECVGNGGAAERRRCVHDASASSGHTMRSPIATRAQ